MNNHAYLGSYRTYQEAVPMRGQPPCILLINPSRSGLKNNQNIGNERCSGTVLPPIIRLQLILIFREEYFNGQICKGLQKFNCPCSHFAFHFDYAACRSACQRSSQLRQRGRYQLGTGHGSARLQVEGQKWWTA